MVWNGAHIHLILNHIPVIGIPFGSILLIVSIWRNDKSIEQIAHWSFIAVSLLTVLVYVSGSYAEEHVIQKLGLSHDIIGPHHNAALYSFIATLVVGGWSILVLAFRQKLESILKFDVSLITLMLSAIASALLAWTANAGGKIQHPEIRPKGWQEKIEHQNSHDSGHEH